jgi:hypothetical protein
VTPDGLAAVGDTVMAPWGERRLIVAIVGAGDLIEAIVERDIATVRAPNYMRDSITATCALYGGTVGREKREIARARKRQTQPIRRMGWNR